MFENLNASLKTVRCKVINLASTNDGYTVLIVELAPSEYIPITIPYNYEFNLKIGDEGILTYEEAIAGVTKWWHKEEEKYYTHNYTAYYYKHFLQDVGEKANTDILLIE